MKIYISVDIEGVTGVTSWSETILGNEDHYKSAEQMTRETLAACEAAIAMGADEIFVKDAHDSARNIDITKLPRCVKLSRGWTNSPESMMAGMDSSFDAAIFIGYHSGGGTNGSPLCHTMNLNSAYMKINGEYASEFVINSYIAADLGVPVIFISGDKMLCEDAKKFNENITAVAVKEGDGGALISIQPDYACDLIKEGVKESLKNISKCKIDVPDKFEVEISYKEHMDAKRASYYPGVTQISSHAVQYIAKNVKDLIVTRMFIQ